MTLANGALENYIIEAACDGDLSDQLSRCFREFYTVEELGTFYIKGMEKDETTGITA